MPPAGTRADSIRLHLTGAVSDGASQPDPAASLGGFRAAEEHESRAPLISGGITNLDLELASGLNDADLASLTAVGDDLAAWTGGGGASARSESETVLNGQSVVLEDPAEPGRFARALRTATAPLEGSTAARLHQVFGNVLGQSDVTGAEQITGRVTHRALMLKNAQAVPVAVIRAYLGFLATGQISDAAQLPAAGAGTLGTVGTFTGWASAGFALIREADGTLREAVYYTIRSSSVLTVPAAGRAQLGTTATAGAATDTLDSISGLRFGREEPSIQPAGFIQTIASPTTVPGGVVFKLAFDRDSALDMGVLAATWSRGLWIEQTTIAGATAQAKIENRLRLQLDSN